MFSRSVIFGLLNVAPAGKWVLQCNLNTAPVMTSPVKVCAVMISWSDVYMVLLVLEEKQGLATIGDTSDVGAEIVDEEDGEDVEAKLTTGVVWLGVVVLELGVIELGVVIVAAAWALQYCY